MKLTYNPHLDAGKKLFSRLQERSFKGYVRSCIEELLANIDANMYTFSELGTTETEVLDLAIGHVGEELLRGHQYPFAYLKLHNDLVCRKNRVRNDHPMHTTHPVAVVTIPVPANDRKAA